MRVIKIVFGVAGLFAASVNATETITYSYDVIGRVKAVTHTGTINNGFATSYVVDDAGNRTHVTVTGSSNRGLSAGGFIVVPLNGYTLIPVSQ